MTPAFLFSGVVVLIGAVVQGAVGYGMALIAAPLLAILDPQLVPVPLLLVVSGHSILAMVRERGATDWRGVGWVTAGRVPGTVLGTLAVVSLAPGPFGVAVGAVVLVCVLLSVTRWRPRTTPGPLFVAGVAAGTMGTAASIGGPPIALLYQHGSGPRIRSTMAACFGFGIPLSVVALAVAGQITVHRLLLAAALVPFLLAGFAISGPVRPILDAGRIRSAVLLVAALSALVLIGQSLLS